MNPIRVDFVCVEKADRLAISMARLCIPLSTEGGLETNSKGPRLRTFQNVVFGGS